MRQLLLFLAGILGSICFGDPLPLTLFDNQRDYSYMWWKDTIKEGNTTFAIKTNQYALSFDYPNLSIESFNIINARSQVARQPVTIRERGEYCDKAGKYHGETGFLLCFYSKMIFNLLIFIGYYSVRWPP